MAFKKRRVWTSQPQEAVEVDWGNQLTDGLVFLAPLWPGQLNDIVGGKRATVTGSLEVVATRDGVFPLFSGTQYIDYGAFGAEFPAGPATVAWIQTPIAQSGFSTVMNLMPNGGVNSWLVYQNGGGGSYAFTFGKRASSGVTHYNTTVGPPVNGNTRRFLVRSPSLDTSTIADYSLLDGLSGPLAPDGGLSYGGNTSTGMRLGALLPSAGDGFDGAIGMVAIWKRQLSDAEARSYNANPFQVFAHQTIWVPVSAGGATTHATTGALEGAGGAIDGAAAHIAKHATSGVLAGSGGSVDGAAARTRAHPTSGVLAGGGAAIAGTARHNVPHAASGVLAGGGGAIDGAADHVVPGGTHDTSGALEGGGASVAGTAAHIAVHATSGVLAGSGAVVDGTATRVAAAVTHATSGALVGGGGVVDGAASGPIVVSDKVGGDDVPRIEIYEKRKKKKRKDETLEAVIRNAMRGEPVEVKADTRQIEAELLALQIEQENEDLLALIL